MEEDEKVVVVCPTARAVRAEIVMRFEIYIMKFERMCWVLQESDEEVSNSRSEEAKQEQE